MRLEYQEIIDRYLLGRMPDDERKSFEEKVEGNQELKEQLEHTKNVKTAISERNELLSKFQKWDDEYGANKNVAGHEKRMWIYGLSGIAAAAVIGYFLFSSSNISFQESSDGLISMNTNNEDSISVAISNKKESEEQENLLAKNDADEKENKHGTTQIVDEQVFSFGKNDIVKASPSQADSKEKELERIVERKNELTRKLANLQREWNLGEMDQVVYESSAGLLKYQRDRLCWQQSIILLNMNRKNEALAILDELRRDDGQYQHKADSLYNTLK